MGRERELALLTASLEEAARGRGGVVLLSGDPGIGKSRLAAEAAGLARERGVRVLVGRCWEAGGAPAYWPWVQSLRAYVRDRDPVTLREEMGIAGAHLRQLLPELTERLPEIPEGPPADPQTARFQLFDAVATFLGNASADRPILLVLEDLHAADRPSLVLLEFLAGAVEEERLLVLGTYRDVDPTLADPLKATVGRLARLPATTRVPLRGLSEEEVARFVRATTIGEAAEGLAPAVARKTEGNPLFVGEIVRLLASEGEMEVLDKAGRLAIPDQVREVITRRLDRLSPQAGEALGVASVLGHGVRLDVLERMTARGAEEILATLEEAIEARLLVETHRGSGQLRFAHTLIRDVVYEGVPPGIRMHRHRDAADALEGGAAGDPVSHLAEVAHHLSEAIPIGESARATVAARRAGDRAMGQLAHEEAARLYEMALRALAETDGDPADRCDLFLSLGEARARAGDGPGSKEAFLEAAGIARHLGDAERLARAGIGYGGRFVWARPAGDPELVPLLQGALRALGEEDGVLRARLLSRLAGALRDDPSREPRWSISREAVEMARRLEDPAVLAYALEARFAATWEPETAEERRGIAEEMMGLARSSGDPERMVQAEGYRVHSLIELGEIEEARTALAAERRLADGLGQPAWRWLVTVGEGCIALLEGRFEAAAAAIEEAREAGRSAQAADAEVSYRLQRFLLDRERGSLAKLEGAIRESVEAFPWYPMFRCLLADIHAELGREREARAVFDRLAEDEFGVVPRDTQWLFAISLLGEVCAALGDGRRAATLHRLLAPFEDRNAYSAPEVATGCVARTLGMLAAAMGRDEQAEAHFERALEIDERMGARPWVAHTQHEYGRMLRDRGGPGDAERSGGLLTEALATARALGMPVLEGRVAGLLDPSALGAAGAPAAEAAPSADMVFRREGEYWTIAYGGAAFRLRDIKGLRYLAHLLSVPGREVHVLDLVASAEGGDPTARRLPEGLEVADAGGGDDLLDAQARRAYRERIEVLQAEMEEAESWQDAERAGRAREELEFVASELASATGLGGRPRRGASAAERARQRVTKAVRLAIAHIEPHARPLADHLSSTVRTGTFCAYLPDPRVSVRWRT